jgi:hypothetical protein
MKQLFYFLLLCAYIISSAYPREFHIFSASRDISTGEPGQIIHKNYFVNLGTNQGVNSGIILDVFRIISESDPYQNKQRFNHKVKIGELEVIHAEEESSIGIIKSVLNDDKTPQRDISNFMIGDRVSVKIDSL